jgi:HEAT repeat protein
MNSKEKPSRNSDGGIGRRRLLQAASAPLALAASASAGTPQRIIDAHVSAGDDWWIGEWMAVDSPASIAETVAMWSDLFGMRRIYWRGQQEEMAAFEQFIRPENFLYAEYYTWTKKLLEEQQLNKVLVREAHKRGMEVHMWAPLFDFTGPADSGGAIEYPFPAQQKLTIEHPEWLPVDRQGFRRQVGPIAFCYPEARKAVIDMYLGYFDRDNYDAIAFFTYCETYAQRYEEEFGFNEPAVAEFKRRYGVDVRREDYDRHAWQHLLGEYVTAFLRELHAALRPRGKTIGLAVNAREPNYPQPWNVLPYTLTAGRIYLDIEGWVREGLVTDLQVWCTRTPMPIQLRAIHRCLDLARDRSTTVGILTSAPASPDYDGVMQRGARIQAALAGEAAWIALGVPEQPVSSLSSKNPYEIQRVLSQVIQKRSSVSAADIAPLARHDRILVRRLALRALQELADPVSLPAIHAALEDSENCVRCSAVRALARVYDASTVGHIVKAITKNAEFSFFEAASATLSRLDESHAPRLLALADSGDPRLRRMALYVIGRREDMAKSSAAAKVLLANVRHQEAYVRFRAVEGLASHCLRDGVVAALIAALRDTDVAVANRAATSLAVGIGPAAGVQEQGWYNGILRSYRAPVEVRDIRLDASQTAALNALAERFQEFRTGYSRPDADWGFRVVGNAMLAFGGAGRRRLEAWIQQRNDRQLAELAWQVVWVRQSLMNFETLGDGHRDAASVYARRPA